MRLALHCWTAIMMTPSNSSARMNGIDSLRSQSSKGFGVMTKPQWQSE
jgi:hypothetical protein